MLSLHSPRWQELEHAYGTAGDIPGLLEQLASLPKDDGESEPWFAIWSALAHQGDVYSASFAAVPHVIAALSKSPETAHESYFHFPAWVEICRAKQTIGVPRELHEPYFSSLSRLPQLAAAEAILEMAEEGTAEKFLEWHYEQ